MTQDVIKMDHRPWQTVWELLKFAKGNFRKLFFCVFLVILSTFCLVSSARTLGELVNYFASEKNPSLSFLYIKGISIFCFEAMAVLLLYQGRRGLSFITNKISKNVRVALFEKITKLAIVYFDSQPLGRSLTR